MRIVALKGRLINPFLIFLALRAFEGSMPALRLFVHHSLPQSLAPGFCQQIR
jgi:hypothetical protein